MSQQLNLVSDDCSPWPPALQFTPEVESGIHAAATLAFGPRWDTPMSELDAEIIARDLLRYTPDFARQLIAMVQER